MQSQSVKKIEFTSAIVREHSMSPTVQRLGTHTSTMELFTSDGTLNTGEGTIEWDVPDIEDGAGIGLWWDTATMALTDYDGVFSLPEQAIEMLEGLGINCDYAKD